MENTLKNPPAFPQPMTPLNSRGGFAEPQTPGMTLLDWFAGQALAGLHANSNLVTHVKFVDIAQDSYSAAEAMLAERERRLKT